MKTLSLALVLATFVVSSHAQKPAWEWTSEERIAVRLDATAIGQRMATTEATSADASPAAARHFVIDGAANSELFLPWELMDHFLSSFFSGNIRARYEADVALQGWNADAFWADMEEIRAAYDAARSAQERLLDPGASMTATQRRDRDRQVEVLNRRICASRAHALRAARAKYPGFDRFLYSAIAPRLVLRSLMPTDGFTLQWIEGGCR